MKYKRNIHWNNTILFSKSEIIQFNLANKKKDTTIKKNKNITHALVSDNITHIPSTTWTST
jgi:thiazole synthase ThiGH ThiG subunit